MKDKKLNPGKIYVMIAGKAEILMDIVLQPLLGPDDDC